MLNWYYKPLFKFLCCLTAFTTFYITTEPWLWCSGRTVSKNHKIASLSLPSFIQSAYADEINIPPTANITTPTANQQVSGFVDIVGTASDVVPLDFSSWTLTYEPFGGSSALCYQL